MNESEAAISAGYWREFKTLAAFYLSFLGIFVVFGIAGHFTKNPVLELVDKAVQAPLVLGFAWLYRKELAAPLLEFKPLRSIGPMLAGAAAIFLFCGLYFWLLSKLRIPMVHPGNELDRAGYPRWSIYAAICVFPGVFEELSCRGVMFASLSKLVSANEALIIQAALFSVLHLLPLIFLSHFFIGLVLGWVRVRTKSLYPGMLLHASWNAFVLWKEFAHLATV